MKKKYSYIGISLVILIIGIIVVPKIVARFKKPNLATFNKVPPFKFTDQNNKTITNKDYFGKVYVVEFFFSTCTSICPIMNTKMVEIQNKFLGNPNFGIASFSITPEIDSPKVLRAYAKKMGITAKNWHLLTGKSDTVVFDLANKGFKLYAGKNDKDSDGFSHSGYFALVDKKGYIRSRFDKRGNPIIYYNALDGKGLEGSGGHNQVKELKEDIKLLLNE